MFISSELHLPDTGAQMTHRTKKRRRLSKAARAKIAASNRRRFSNPAIRAAYSERMSRKRADPAFNAAHLASMRYLNSDPHFKAANRARMRRRNADPAFRAKRRAAVSIPAAARAAIVAALKADPHAKRVATKIAGASYWTVLRIAKAERIKLGNPKLTPWQKCEAVRRRERGECLSSIARRYDVHPSTICRLAA
jgi:CENP-B N-terminal DNA-binding domain